MYCRDCGHQLDDNAAFCSTCGCQQTRKPDDEAYSKDHFIVSTKDGHKYILHKDVIRRKHDDNVDLFHDTAVDSVTGEAASIQEILKLKKHESRFIRELKSFLAAAFILGAVVPAAYFIATNYEQILPAKHDIASISEQYRDSIVTINTYDRRGKQIGLGTGVVIKEDGLILTNNHVIEEANYADVRLENGLEFPVKDIVFGSDQYDLALIRIPAKELKPARIGNSDKIGSGDPIVCIGNPIGLENTVSEGIISNVRDVSKELKLIQFTAPISPGSSGGVLINAKGETIGITTMYLTVGQNLNFAVPINYLVTLVEHSAADTRSLADDRYGSESRIEGLASQHDQPSEVPQSRGDDKPESDYILPDSSSRNLTDDEVKGLSKEELRQARNEIFARHGYTFDSRQMQNYFASKPWYTPNPNVNEKNSPELNSFELFNIALIMKYEGD